MWFIICEAESILHRTSFRMHRFFVSSWLYRYSQVGCTVTTSKIMSTLRRSRHFNAHKFTAKTYGVFLSTVVGFGTISMTKSKIVLAEDDGFMQQITDEVLRRAFDKWAGFKGSKYTTQYPYLRWKREHSIGFSWTDTKSSVGQDHSVCLLEIAAARYVGLICNQDRGGVALQSVDNPHLISVIETAYNLHGYMSNELLINTVREWGYIVAFTREMALPGFEYTRLQIWLVKYDRTAQNILGYN
eukprot:855609_1